MKRRGNNRKLLIGSWIMLGFLTAGLNGYHLLALMDTPLAGYSDSVRFVDRGIRQLKNLLAAENEKIEAGLNLLSERYAAAEKIKASSKRETTKSSVDPQLEMVAPIALPVLTGILSKWSTNGEVEHLALLDGIVCLEGDRVGDLTVKRISHQGVRLARGGKVWFIEAPEHGYSLALH
jgi:hypothetical protein